MENMFKTLKLSTDRLKRMDASAILFYLLFILLSISCVFRTINHDLDFKVFYRTAQLFINGDFDFYNISRDGIFTYKYGPIFPIIFSPMGFFTLNTAQAFWGIINAASFIIAWFYSEKFLHISFPSLKMSNRARLLTLLLCLDTVSLNAIQGNVNVVLFTLMISSVVLFLEQRIFLSCVLVAIACAIKILPGVILLFFVVSKNKKAIFYFVMSFIVVAILIPILVYGYEVFITLIKSWVLVLSDVKHFMFTKYNNQSPYIIVYRVFGSNIFANIATIMAIITSATLFVYSYYNSFIYRLFACFFAFLTIPNTVWVEYHLVLLPFIMLITNMAFSTKLHKICYILIGVYVCVINLMVRGIVGKALANVFAFYGNHLLGLVIIAIILIVENNKISNIVGAKVND